MLHHTKCIPLEGCSFVSGGGPSQCPNDGNDLDVDNDDNMARDGQLGLGESVSREKNRCGSELLDWLEQCFSTDASKLSRWAIRYSFEGRIVAHCFEFGENR